MPVRTGRAFRRGLAPGAALCLLLGASAASAQADGNNAAGARDAGRYPAQTASSGAAHPTIRAVSDATGRGASVAGGSADAGGDDPAAHDAAAAGATGRDAASVMGRLFAGTCFRHAGDTAALRADLTPPRFRPMPDGVSHAVLPRPGLAFTLPPDAPGHLMVLSFDDGWCGTGGTGIDPAALTNSLADAVRAAGGGEMRLMGADPAGREQRYLIDRPQRSAVALLVLLMPEPGGTGLVQASLFASEMRNADPAP